MRLDRGLALAWLFREILSDNPHDISKTDQEPVGVDALIDPSIQTYSIYQRDDEGIVPLYNRVSSENVLK